jgi:hypothetical protein
MRPEPPSAMRLLKRQRFQADIRVGLVRAEFDGFCVREKM